MPDHNIGAGLQEHLCEHARRAALLAGAVHGLHAVHGVPPGLQPPELDALLRYEYMYIAMHSIDDGA